MFEDVDGQRTLTDILQEKPTFLKLPDSKGSLGFRSGNVWFRFRLNNNSDRHVTLVLDTDIPSLNKAGFYSPLPNGSYNAQLFGDEYAYGNRALNNRYFTFPLDIAPNSSGDYYLRYKREANMYFLVSLSPTLAYYEKEMKLTNIIYMSVGITLGLLLYNLILYVFTRDISYLYYCSYTFSFGAFLALFDGLAFQYWPTIIPAEWKLKSMWGFLVISIIFLVQFSRVFLDSARQLRNWDRLCILLMALLGIALITMPFLSGPLMESISSGGLIISYPILFTISLISWRRGHRSAGVFVLAFTIFLISASLSVLYVVGYRDIGLLDMSMVFTRWGFCLNLILLSIAQAYRLVELRGQQTRAAGIAKVAKRIAETKTEFLTTMSHEIRTPMNGVLGMLDLLGHSPLNDEQKIYQKTASSSGMHLLHIIDNILDYSKADAGKMQIEVVPYNLETVVNNCASQFFDQCRTSPVQLVIHILPDTPKLLMGDPTRITQLLTNLIGNAFKFTEEGYIQLRVSKITKEGEEWLHFEVSDSGVGLTEKQKDLLFTAFSQADSSISRRYGGTGLGLSICKNLVSLMEGHIDVISEYGKGSTFFFDLPLRVAEEGELALDSLQKKELRGIRLLVVDDDEIISESIRGMTIEWEMDVVFARSADSALASIKESCERNNFFDVALIDYVLPGRDGLAVAAEIRQISAYRHLPMILISAFKSLLTLDMIRDSGIKYGIDKPITSSDLSDVLRRSLGSTLATNEMGPEQLSELKILIVEDNAVNLLVIQSLLKIHGLTTESAENGLLALEAFEKFYEQNDASFDVIIMDCEMPIIDGYTATKAIRSLENDFQLPLDKRSFIIGLSAHALEESKSRGIEAGMDVYMTKPIDKELLLKTLKDAMSHSSK